MSEHNSYPLPPYLRELWMEYKVRVHIEQIREDMRNLERRAESWRKRYPWACQTREVNE